jgi:FixJ family two-component response regulator
LAAESVLNCALGRGEVAANQVPETVLPEQSLISIVDDDQSFRESMRRLLKSLGYTVTAFPSAAAFLSSPKLVDTCCLVADVHMPAITGVELYTHLVEAGRVIPTILVTAYPDDNVRKRMLSMGVKCYLSKPLEEAEFIGCLHSACARGNAPR